MASMSKVFTVSVKSGSRKGPKVERGSDVELVVYVREQAVDGKANAAVVRLLADYFNVPKTAVEIIRGHGSKIKFIKINNLK